MKRSGRGRTETGRNNRHGRTGQDKQTPRETTKSDQHEVTRNATRQTTAYLKNLFSEVGFSIDSKKGQNFLVDINLLDLLERTADVQPDDIVLEVGTGTAALTERLARSAFRVVTVEIDSRLATLAHDRLVDRPLPAPRVAHRRMRLHRYISAGNRRVFRAICQCVA